MDSAQEQMTKFACPHCDQRIGVPYAMVGMTVSCPTCHDDATVPRPTGAVPLRSVKRRDVDSGRVGLPTVDHMPCPYCEEPIRTKARKCKHCGEFLDEGARRETGGTGHAPRLTAAERISRISARERQTASTWIVIGIMQCLTGVLAIAGAWNIVHAVKARKRAGRILERDAAVPKELDPLGPLVLTVFINLLFGAGLGAPAVLLDAVVRRKVLDDRRLFRRNSGGAASQGSLGRKMQDHVVLTASHELAYTMMRDTLVDEGGSLCTDDSEGGILVATWPYGSNVFGLRVTSFIQRTSDGHIQVTIRGGFKDMADTFGHARHKAIAIRETYIEQFDDTDLVTRT